MFKPLLTLILLAAQTNGLFACLAASQCRLFPLGQCSKGLVVVETHLYRTESRGKTKELIEMKPAWFGKSYFKIYDKNHKEVYSELIDTIKQFKQHQYDSILGKTFSKGLELAAKYSNLVYAKPVSIKFCDYQEKCSCAELLFDTIANKISILLPNKTKHEIKVLFDTTSMASTLVSYYGGYEEMASLAKSFKGNFYINSVREFKIGAKRLTVVHLGSGDSFELTDGGTYPPGKEYNAKFSFTDLTKSTFVEPVLHHGKGFDFYIWN